MSDNPTLLKDIVYDENYANRVKALLVKAHLEGQAMGIQNMFKLIKDFENKRITVTTVGLMEYMKQMVPVEERIAEVTKKVEEVTKKVEEILPIPDNVVQLFPKKK